MAGRKRKYSDSLNPKMVELYNQGLSLYAIGKKLEVHPQVVKRRLNEMGIDTRDKSEAMTLYHERRRGQKDKS